jgi:transcriptional regulator with XRE-family HTH domain
MVTTGQRIKTLRLSRGLSQEELGEMIGVKKAAINKYENGIVVNLKQSTIARLSEALEVSPSYLMGFEDEEAPTPVTGSGLTEKEIRIAKWFNSLPPETQKAILTLGDGPKDLAE